MPFTKEVLDRIKGDIDKAEASLNDLKEVVADMRLSGMDTTKQDAQVAELSTKLRQLEMFYELRKAKL